MKQREQKTRQPILVILLALCAFSLTRCKKDESSIPSATDNSSITVPTGATNLTTKITTISPTSYDITKSLPAGYVKDGSVDYTTYIQKAINTYSDVTFPAFPIMVDDAGLCVGSNKTLTFLDGSKLVLKPTATGNYNIIKILMATNVTLNNPVVVGDRYNHLGTTGEWGQGIAINGSSNVTINNPNVSNCWGDGIFMCQKGGMNNTNIKIVNAYCKYNRRNGIAITNAVGLVLESPYAAYTNGTAPCTGIDIEPNSCTDEIQNVVINNAKTEYNPGFGISIGLKNLCGGSNKTIGVQLNNPSDKGSDVAFHATSTLTQQVGTESLSGNINVVNPFWRRNTNTPITTNLLFNSLKLSISKPAVQDVVGANLTQAQIVSLFTYKTHINREANYALTF